MFSAAGLGISAGVCQLTMNLAPWKLKEYKLYLYWFLLQKPWGKGMSPVHHGMGRDSPIDRVCSAKAHGQDA